MSLKVKLLRAPEILIVQNQHIYAQFNQSLMNKDDKKQTLYNNKKTKFKDEQLNFYIENWAKRAQIAWQNGKMVLCIQMY